MDEYVENKVTITLEDGSVIIKNFMIEDLGEELYNSILNGLKSIENREALLGSLEQVLNDRDEAICTLYEMALGE